MYIVSGLVNLQCFQCRSAVTSDLEPVPSAVCTLALVEGQSKTLRTVLMLP
jgi:hypothetical protein